MRAGLLLTGGSGGFRLDCSAGAFAAGALVVATGGLSIPKMGATGLVYELARQFGLKVVEPRPALVPLVLGGREKGWVELAGVAADVTAQAVRGAEVSREAAGDASRIERAGGAAGFVVLAAGRGYSRGFRAGNERQGRLLDACAQMEPAGTHLLSNRRCANCCRSGWRGTWPRWAHRRDGQCSSRGGGTQSAQLAVSSRRHGGI